MSLFYSLAEAARTNDQLPPPVASERIAAKGAESPEAALRQLAEAAALSDWRRVIELTSPTEMAVLHDYGAMILRDAPERVTEPAVRIERFEFERKSARNATILAPKALSATFRAGDTEGSFELEHTNADCWHVVVRIDGETNTDETGCGSDGFGEVGKDLTTEQRTQLARLQTFVGVAVTEVDGRWYVSPARTIGRLLPIYGTAIGIMTSRTS